MTWFCPIVHTSYVIHEVCPKVRILAFFPADRQLVSSAVGKALGLLLSVKIMGQGGGEGRERVNMSEF